MKNSMKNKVCHLLSAILLTSGLVGCGGTTTPTPTTPTPTTGVTVNVTGTSTLAAQIILAKFSSGQVVPTDASTLVGAWMGSSGTLVDYKLLAAGNNTAPPGIFEAGNYGLITGASSPDTCQVTTLTNATADTSKSYSGSDTNNFYTDKKYPIIPITLTSSNAIINITCNKLATQLERLNQYYLSSVSLQIVDIV